VRTKKILQETIPIILIAVMPPVWFRSDNIGGSDNLCRTALIVKVEGILLIKKKRLETLVTGKGIMVVIALALEQQG
jgi:hypothetical protein